MSGVSESRIKNFLHSFSDLMALPRAFWFVVGAFSVESMAYFGILTLMTSYVSTDLGWGDTWAGVSVSIFSGLVTLFMLGVGSYAESFGLRRAILFALIISTLGRCLYSYAPAVGGGAIAVVLVLTSLVIVAIGSAILQPVCYSGVKQYTNEKTSSMGYGLIYAIMNLGIVAVGAISSWVRPGVKRIHSERANLESIFDGILTPLADWTESGIQAVNWVCVAITAFTLLAFWVLMTRKAEANKLRADRAEALRKASTTPWRKRIVSYFAEGPFTNARFIFFIFMLLPVRTLFAHQWLTMPQYIIRAYPEGIGNNMEKLVNWINPLIIVLGVPIATALTRRVSVYRMMLVGSLVSAAPTFLLASGPNLSTLITYLVLFSIGEALWSARFLEYASELAPEGRIAQYMGLASIPWLLAKMTTGIYSGRMLATYCPADTPPEALHTETMWILYGCIAMASPIGLWLARKWVMAGLHTKAVTPA